MFLNLLKSKVYSPLSSPPEISISYLKTLVDNTTVVL